MAKATATKFWRKLEPVGKYLFKRAKVIAPKDRHIELCRGCGEPMPVADGQIAYFHKECRTKVRSRVNQGKPRKHA